MARTFLLTGGGSGGHVTPLLAVAAEIKKREPDARVVYIGTRGDKIGKIAHDHSAVDRSYSIFAGKFRRYHGEGWRQWLNVWTIFFNVRDVLYIALGVVQSLYLVAALRPFVVFIKGGFVGVPVGLASAFWRKPFVTHDSDAIPGLANKIIGRWARYHATGMPAELYPYPTEKTIYTGTPVQSEFTEVTATQRLAYRAQFGIPATARVLFMTGGGLGAQRLNEYMADIVPRLLAAYPDMYILQTVGHANVNALSGRYAAMGPDVTERVIVKDFVLDLHAYSGAADVVVMRASATSMAEMAVQGKACILVPNPLLTGGHQVKNAQAFAVQDAALVVTEDSLAKHGSDALYQAITVLFDDPAERAKCALNICKFAIPDATERLVGLLIKAGGVR